MLFRRATGRLLQLSTPDHVSLEEDYEPDSGIDPNALTRVIGQCRFNEANQRYETIPGPVPVVRAQLAPGDLLLLASDGLVECIHEATSQDRFGRLEAELQRLHLTDHPLKQLVVRLIRRGYTGRGFWMNVVVMMLVTLVIAAASVARMERSVIRVGRHKERSRIPLRSIRATLAVCASQG